MRGYLLDGVSYFCCNLSEGAGKHLPSRDDDFLTATEKELSSLNFLTYVFLSLPQCPRPQAIRNQEGFV